MKESELQGQNGSGALWRHFSLAGKSPKLQLLLRVSWMPAVRQHCARAIIRCFAANIYNVSWNTESTLYFSLTETPFEMQKWLLWKEKRRFKQRDGFHVRNVSRFTQLRVLPAAIREAARNDRARQRSISCGHVFNASRRLTRPQRGFFVSSALQNLTQP